MNAGIITLLVTITGLLVLSLYLLQGKGGFLIAGYNTLPKEEKKKYDEPALCKAMGKMMLAVTGSLLFFVLGAVLDKDWPFILGTVMMIATILVGMIYINLGNRYRKI